MEPFLGEIRIFAFPFAPRGWALCDGAELQIRQNQALYAIIGNNYGGNGSTTFNLPDLRGRTAIHTTDAAHTHPGEQTGKEDHTLAIAEMPLHNHQARASAQAATTGNPAGNYWAISTANNYGTDNPKASTAPALANSGSSQGHSNMQPYTVINYCIAITGIFPPRD